MVKIRLRRVGAKKQPHYRVVVAESRSPRDGRFVETIGHYNPRTEPVTMEVDAERALHWLSVGAQPSEAVRRIFDKLGIMAQFEAMRRGEALAEAMKPEPELVEELEEALAAEEGDEDEGATAGEPAEEGEDESEEGEDESEDEEEPAEDEDSAEEDEAEEDGDEADESAEEPEQDVADWEEEEDEAEELDDDEDTE